jgi:DNA-binding winged helix-turn-helix (wHTH) protein
MGTELVFAQTQDNTGVPAVNLTPNSRFLRFGNFHVDLKREELFRDGTRVRLPGKVYQVLLALVEQPGEIVTRGALRARLWPQGTYVNYDANVNTTVNKLRQALGDSPTGPQYIETIPRQGYSFIAKIERSDRAPSRETFPTATSHVAAGSETSAEKIAGNWVLVWRLLPTWAKVGAVALLVTGMLFGAGLVMYAYHGF